MLGNVHWYASVLYKRFLTLFHDGVRNRLQVSDCDRGVLPTPTQQPSGICPPGTDARQNEVVCDRRALKYGNTYSRAKKIQLYGEIVSGRKYIPHSQSPLNVFVRMHIPHSRSKENVSIHRYITHNFPVKSFVIALPLHTILTILSFALLNASHMVHRRNCVAKVVHHTHFLCGKHLRKVA